ncbi:MAG: hypothetical protein ABR860_13135 [Terracidiphilus sp.]|jgi:hypothetical protein
MTFPNNNDWQIVTGVTTVAAVAALALWLVLRRRPSAEEIERARRQFLVQSGRLVDGMLLDVYEVNGADGRTLTFLLFNYRIAGVDYECSQEITAMRGVVDAAEVRAGFPCTVRYQPGNPNNSIVIAEGWTGLRAGLPQFPSIDDPNPLDRSHLEPDAH